MLTSLTFIEPVCDPIVYGAQGPGAGDPGDPALRQPVQVVEVVVLHEEDTTGGEEGGVLEQVLLLQPGLRIHSFAPSIPSLFRSFALVALLKRAMRPNRFRRSFK